MIRIPVGLVAVGLLVASVCACAEPATEDRRPTDSEQIEFDADEIAFAADTAGSLLASVYSLTSSMVSADEAGAFVSAVRRIAPERPLFILSDIAAPARFTGSRNTFWIPTKRGPYSLWPRDPFSIVRREAGGVVVLLRPNLQSGRETDSTLGVELAEGLPAVVVEQWGGVGWTHSPVPFHNGQVLLEPDRAWISIHTLEPWLLESLGVERVPVASFSSAPGVARYVGEAQRLARRLEGLYGREVRFVHPLPGKESLAEQSELMVRLGGGAGFDLDSLLTLLPPVGGQTVALVADLSLGGSLIRSIPPQEWKSFRDGFRLWPAIDDLARELSASADSSRSRGLDLYLDLMADSLREQGLSVERLPLILVPTRLLEEREFRQPDFTLGWNNVVIEAGDNELRAEGFSSLFSSADRKAMKKFGEFGVRLDLVPPLTTSVVLNGGYRCASNHLRSIPEP